MDIRDAHKFVMLHEHREKMLQLHRAVTGGSFQDLVFFFGGNRHPMPRNVPCDHAIRKAAAAYVEADIQMTNKMLLEIGVTTPPFPTPES